MQVSVGLDSSASTLKWRKVWNSNNCVVYATWPAAIEEGVGDMKRWVELRVGPYSCLMIESRAGTSKCREVA